MPDERNPVGGSVNYGIQVGGSGVLNANAVAAGPGARARSDVSTSPLTDDPALLCELRRQVEELVAALSAEADRLGEQEVALAAVREGAAELAKGRPERHVVVAAFKRAAAGVASAGAVAGSIQSILQLLGVR